MAEGAYAGPGRSFDVVGDRGHVRGDGGRVSGGGRVPLFRLGRVAPEWATAPIARARFDRNAEEIGRYVEVERRFSSEVQDLAGRLMSRQIGEDEAVRAFRSRLEQAETESFVAGRRLRGATGGQISEAEAQMLAGRNARNVQFFRKFASDIREGRGRMNYMRRADLYAKSLWSIFTRGESADWDRGGGGARYWWILDVDAEHCESCLARAKECRDLEGFTWQQLAERGWPGENTDCQVNCRCHVRTVRGALIIPEADLRNLEPAATAEGGLKTIEELLGGPSLPARIPVAGSAPARLRPAVVEEALQADEHPEDLARLLPVLPRLLAYPDEMQATDWWRVLWGFGLKATLERRPTGIWDVTGLSTVWGT